MNLQRERARFEEWIITRTHSTNLGRLRHCVENATPGTYAVYNVQLSWEAWCAALGIKE